jgi:hypothetical protein
LPKEAWAAFDAGNIAKGEEIITKMMVSNTQLRWTITQGVWSFGASSIWDFLQKTKLYSVADCAHQIQCPCLVLEAEGDQFFLNQPQKIYDALKVPKTLFKFTKEEGAENHCQSGALSYKDEIVFNWLDETMKLHKGRLANHAAQ